MAMTETLEHRRLTLVNALRAGKGWMTGYAEAFVDQYVEEARLTQPAQAVDVDSLYEVIRGFGYTTRDQSDELADAVFKHISTRALAGEKAQGWIPIETAPQSTKHLLLFGDGPAIFNCAAIGCWVDERWRLIGGDTSFQPTHWMPIPTPPTDGEE